MPTHNILMDVMLIDRDPQLSSRLTNGNCGNPNQP
jgi:hypothetical protein